LHVCEDATFISCKLNTKSPPTRLCRGPNCAPALILSMGTDEITPWGVFGDPQTGLITMFEMGRPDTFPAAKRYGGTVNLLKSILSQVDVRAPQPGEIPS